MSLVHAANYLAAQGRGKDTHLVHMTSKELAAMQKLAESQGKSLTINPQTGLPEAGVLSTVLPMALGAAAAASGQWWAIPAAVAVSAGATYAYTGSITKGLMAGIGAWSGGNLASGFAEAGASTIAAEGGDLAAQEFAKSQTQALTGQALDASRGMVEPQLQELAKSQIGNMPNLTADQITNMTGRGLTDANAEMLVRNAGAANAAMGSGPASGMLKGVSSLSSIGDVLSNNKAAALGAVAPLVTGAFGKQQSANVPGSTAERNPFGLKEIPRDENGKPIFNASIPAQPNPAYTPVYRDYVKNPYVSGAADGGVMGYAPGGKTKKRRDNQDMVDAELRMEPARYVEGLGFVNPPPSVGGRLGANFDALGGNIRAGISGNAMMDQDKKIITRPEMMDIGYRGKLGSGELDVGLQRAIQSIPGRNKDYAINARYSASFAEGGVPGYKGSTDYGSMVEGIGEVERGLEMATKRRPLEVPNPYVEIEPDEPELRRLDPHNRARKMLEMLSSSSRVKMAKGLPQSNVLGAISTDPAKVIAEQRAKESIAAEQTSQEAKEGGLMSMAEGGESHVYKPTYTDYQATPFDMQRAMQAYNPQALPVGLPMNQQQMVGSQGYPIDPSVMKSNAQIAAEAEAKRLAELQALQASGPMGLIESVAGIKAGGLMAGGGPANLGDYSDGGRLLKGPGDGVSDSIPATIGGKQPARLATGEFVIPARIVSELGNGSTDAGAKRLYAMMDRIKAKRSKTKNIAADTKAYKYLPA